MIRGAELQKLREKYPVGTVVVLDRMDDFQSPPVGTVGEVTYIDDIGSIHVSWQNGSSLALIPDEDEFHIKGDSE